MAANVSTNLASWSTTESSNSPAGTDTSDIDAELRMIQTVVRKYLATKGADIASGATVDLSAATGNYVHITGTTNITALGTVSAGMRFMLVFDGALTFTHNATSLILPGAANITTAAGDRCEVVSLGSGNWRCMWYTKASGAPVGSYQPLDADLTALAGLTSAANKIPMFSGSGTATVIDFKDEDNMASDSATAVPSQQSVKAYVDTTVAANSGKLIQRGYDEYTAATALTTTIPLDDTIPQNTEGTEILSVALSALSSASNIVRVRFQGQVATVTDANAIVALFWDSVAGALAANCTLGPPAQQGGNITLEFEHVPGDTAVHTYALRAGPDSAVSLYFNTNNGTRVFGGVSRATLIVEEFEP